MRYYIDIYLVKEYVIEKKENGNKKHEFIERETERKRYTIEVFDLQVINLVGIQVRDGYYIDLQDIRNNESYYDDMFNNYLNKKKLFFTEREVNISLNTYKYIKKAAKDYVSMRVFPVVLSRDDVISIARG